MTGGLSDTLGALACKPPKSNGPKPRLLPRPTSPTLLIGARQAGSRSILALDRASGVKSLPNPPRFFPASFQPRLPNSRNTWPKHFTIGLECSDSPRERQHCILRLSYFYNRLPVRLSTRGYHQLARVSAMSVLHNSLWPDESPEPHDIRPV